VRTAQAARCAAVAPAGWATWAMGTTYEEEDWGTDLTDEPTEELDDDREESWLLNDGPPLAADEPE
jgi:hypothetical protein